MAGKGSFELGEADFLAAHRAGFASLFGWRFWRVVLIIAAAAGVGMTFVHGQIDGAPLGESVGTGVMMAVILAIAIPACGGVNYLLLPRRVRRLFAQNRIARYPQSIAWDDAAITHGSALGTVTIPWRDYWRWDEGKGVMLLYTNDYAFHVVALRALAEADRADLRATLVEHGPPRR